MQRTSVPKAPVDEHRHTLTTKIEIRPSLDCGMPPPPGDALDSKQLRDSLFGGHIAPAAYPCHDEGPFRLGKNICHGTHC
jgi:hypothetical protein